MPYHVLVTRQILLDGPMTLFATLALYAVALREDGRGPWLYAAGAALGLSRSRRRRASCCSAASMPSSR